MSKTCLHFNLAQNSTYKIATFKDLATKNQYVDAEFHDPKCIQAYYNYQAATRENRKYWAQKLDQIRFAFYEKWKKQNNIIEHNQTFSFEEDDLV